MPLIRRDLASTMLLTASLVLACGKGDTDNSVEDPGEAASGQAAPVTAAAEPAGNPVSAPLTPDDIGRWEKGLAGELRTVEEAGAKMKTARTSEDTLSAMMGVQEMNTIAAGAQAAGLEQERYKFVRSNLSAVTNYLTPSQGGIDTTMLSQAQRDELRQSNEARIQQMQQDVPAEVVEALRPRAVELRKKSWELIGARLKGGGMQ